MNELHCVRKLRGRAGQDSGAEIPGADLAHLISDPVMKPEVWTVALGGTLAQCFGCLIWTRGFLTGFSVLQKLASDPRCKGMPLSSFLLKPMQRITRYPLLIRSVSPRLAGQRPDTQGAVIPLPVLSPVCGLKANVFKWAEKNRLKCHPPPQALPWHPMVTACWWAG